MKHNITFIICFLFTLSWAYGQKTGSYDTTITFNGNPRTLSIYVPANYNPVNKYRLMICLHGLGDNSTNYRNALINSLAWQTNIPNTIFVCPSPKTNTADFTTPAGEEQIIPTAITFAKSNYNIDAQNVVLQGFSLGGRAALRYALNNPTDFKGVLLNTPAVQGVKEAVNKSLAGYTFNYANASKVPVYITNGSDDVIYIAPIDSMTENLVLNNGAVKHSVIQGMGHSIPTFPAFNDFLSFFDAPAKSTPDVEVVKVIIPARTCNTMITSSCLVRNLSLQPISSVTFDYTIDGNKQSYTWNGSLAAYQHAIVPLPASSITTPGAHTAEVKIVMLNTNITDSITANNIQTAAFELSTQARLLPFGEGFEGASFPPAGWLLSSGGDLLGEWYEDTDVKKTGNKSMGNFNTILIFDNSTRRSDLVSPMLNLASLPRPHLTFDLAYNYQHYTPPYFTAETDFADTLEVRISTDCGATYTTLFKKGGKDLATFGNPVLNPLSVQDCFISPTNNDWKTILVDLNNYATVANAFISFSYISALGGAINIDNIGFSNDALAVNEVAEDKFTVYPNPASKTVTVNFASPDEVQDINLLDINGKLMPLTIDYRVWGPQSIDVSHLPAGIYVLQVIGANKTTSKKLVIEK